MKKMNVRKINNLLILFALIIIAMCSCYINYKIKQNQTKIANNDEKIYIEKTEVEGNEKLDLSVDNINIDSTKKTVKLTNRNCEYKSENEKVIISKYQGEEDCLVIPNRIDGKKVEKIEKDAFKECYNLEIIKVPAELKDIIPEIECFEINEKNSNDEYIELNTTREYSEIYKAYMSLTEEQREKVLINPYKFEMLATESNEYELSAAASVSKYDVRDYVPVEVENQGRHGTCYAYAALSSMEIWIAKNRGELVDFSEIHAGVHSNGAGGFFSNIKSYINSSDGPVWEADWGIDTYSDRLKESDYNMINSYLSGTEYSNSDIKYMQEILASKKIEGEIDSKSYLLPSNNTLKNHIMTYGSICSYYYHDNNYLNTNYKRYTVYNYTGSIVNMPDHAVCIIGWDDNFSRENFPEEIRPKKDGAFLVLNSWGENWGTDGGCFWVSYEDTWLGRHEAIGVTNVIGLGEEITLNKMIIKNAETGENIEKIKNVTNLVRRGLEIDINFDLKYEGTNTLVNPNDLVITLRNDLLGVNIKPTVTSKNGYISINVDTQDFISNEDYIIDIAYRGEIISRTIRIIPEYDYEIKADKSIKLIAYKGKEQIDMTVPKTYLGYIVSELGEDLFYESDILETVTIYSTVKKIGANVIPKGVLIFGNENSTVETYASDNKYAFAKIGQTMLEGGYWKFDIPNKTLEITGVMSKYIGITAPWMGFNRNIDHIKVNSGAERIGSYAFYECKNLKSVTGLENVTQIGNYAFYECKNLETVDKMNNIKSIGTSAFYGCNKIIRLSEFKNLEKLGSYAFYQCSGLVYIGVTEKLTGIGDRAFYECTGLASVEGLSGVKAIGEKAFYKCTELIYALNLINVTDIGNGAFYGCTSLRGVGPMVKVENIKSEAFYGCTSLLFLEKVNSVKNIGKSAFDNCTSLRKIEIGKSIESIQDNAFEGCSNLTMYVHKDTQAEAFAKNNSITYKYTKIDSIELKQLPTKTRYQKGNELDLTGGKILVKYEDGISEEILMNNEHVGVTGYDKTVLGEQNITITYNEKMLTFAVKVTNDIIGIELKESPYKLEYIKEEELDLTGGKILVKYENADTEEISLTDNQITIIGYDKTALGEQEIVAKYGEFEVVFKVKVINEETGIKLETKPSKLTYIKGEELDLTGGVLIVTHQNTVIEEIPLTNENVTITGYDKTILGEQTIIVEYKNYTVRFGIKVTNELVNVNVKSLPIKTKYIRGEELDLTGGIIEAIYQDNTIEEIAMTEEVVKATGYNKKVLGNQNITIEYSGVTTNFTVSVEEKKIIEINTLLETIMDKKVEPGSTIVTNLKLQSSNEEVIAVYGRINYNEYVSSIQVNAKNEWQIEYIPETGEFYAYKAQGAKTEDIIEISYVTKNNTEGKSAIINVTNINYMTKGYDEILGEDVLEEVIIEEKDDNNNQNQDNEPKPDDNNNNQEPDDDKNEQKPDDNNNQKPDDDQNEQKPDDNNNQKPDDDQNEQKPDNNNQKPSEEDKENNEDNNSKKVLTSIEVSKKPKKQKYKEGQNVDLTGIVVTAKYSDGTEEKLTNYMYAPYGAVKESDKKVRIIYVDGTDVKSTEYKITVEESKELPYITDNDNKQENDNNKEEEKLPNNIPGDSVKQDEDIISLFGLEVQQIVVIAIGSIIALGILIYVFKRR